MPGFQGAVDVEPDVLEGDRPVMGKAEFLERRQPLELEGIARLLQVADYILQVGPDVSYNFV